jgi:hypothetical protein
MIGSKGGYWNHVDVAHMKCLGEKIFADLDQDYHYSGADYQHSFVYVLLEAQEIYFAMIAEIGVALH